MNSKQFNELMKKYNNIVNTCEDKLNSLNKDYFIVSNIIFTSDKDYYYLFTIYSDNKIIDKVDVSDAKDYKEIYKQLTIKYKTNVIYNYDDLTTKQLNYLEDIEDININQDEVVNLIFKRKLDII